MLTHGNLTWNCYNLLVDLDLAGDEVALVTAPMFHTAALNHTALPVFLKGGTNVLVGQVRPREVLRPDRRAPDHADVRGAGDVPADRAVARGGPTADLSSLRILHCGGAPVPTALIRTYQERGLTFVQGFGMTEASPGVLLLRPEDSVRKAGSAGTPHVLHRRAGRRSGRDRRRRRRAGRGAGARPERHGRLLAAARRDRAAPWTAAGCTPATSRRSTRRASSRSWTGSRT